MAKNTFTIFKETDETLIKQLVSIGLDCQFKNDGHVTVYIAEGLQNTIQTNGNAIETDENLKLLYECSSALAWQVTISFKHTDPNMTFSILVKRQDSSDIVTVTVPDNAPLNLATKFLASSHKNLRAYSRTESTDKVLGDELAEFYRKREKGLLQLEELTQKLINQNEQFRTKIEDDFLAKRTSLEEEISDQKNRIEESFEEKEKDLKKRSDDLELKIKSLDNSSNTHARRKLRQELKEIISDRNKDFRLTKGTSRKRTPVHIAFIATILALGYFAFTSLLKLTLDPAGFTNENIGLFSLLTLKSVISVVGLLFMVIYYIRWNDKWSDAHAEEEFRLKRLDLDIDRASWVVEMALEWQKEKDSVIPPELIERLTKNLFDDQKNSKRATHPNEDLLATLLGSSSALRLNIPTIGQVDLDRKSLKDFSKARKENDA